MRKSVSLLLPLFVSLSIQAQTPYLVKDINTTYSNATKSSSPAEFVRFGNRTFFTATTDAAGKELWSTDGTSAGTSMVADIVPGSGSSEPVGLIVINGRLLFNARDVNHGIELWSTDGTAAGTQMVIDLNPGPSSSQAFSKFAYKNGMLFSADDGTNGRELWFTDGTAGGTRMVKDVRTGSASSSPTWFTPLGNSIVFYASGEIWKTDGTDAGTVKIASVQARNFVLADSQVLFEGFTSDTGYELWATDGTSAGTHMVTDIFPGAKGALESSFSGLGFTKFGDRALFLANDGVHGRELWITDGTAAGTHMVADLVPGSAGAFDSAYAYVTTLADNAYFVARDAEHGAELWVTDGTEAATHLFADLVPGTGSSNPFVLQVSGGKLYVVAGSNATAAHDLWVTDGGAPHRLAAPDLMGLLEGSLWAAGGNVYFSGFGGLTGSEPWVSDGTDAGTHMIANLAADASPSAQPNDLTAAGGTLLFYATSGASSSDLGLWRTDGTSAGTYKLRDNTFRFGPLVPAGPIALFTDGLVQKQMLTDGTIEGTKPADDFLSRFGPSLDSWFLVPFDDFLYAFTSTNTSSYTLWKTTAAPGATATKLGVASHQGSVAVAGRFFFFARSPVPPYVLGLWITDGTPQGTYAVTPDLGTSTSGPLDIVAAQGMVYFILPGDNASLRLVRSDGTIDGMVTVKQLPANILTSLTAAGRKMFFAMSDALWVSDGTEAGTVEVAKTKLYSPSNPKLVAVGDRVLFTQTGDAGLELWVSDGTPAGTKLLQKVSQPPSPVNVDGLVYFSGTDGDHGSEPWVTDGTTEGTRLVADIQPGAIGSDPYSFTRAGNVLYFGAVTNAAGTELWALPLSESHLSIDDARIVEGDSSTSTLQFRVSLAPAAAQPVTVDYTTADGTAHAGEDYDTSAGTLTFAPGETSKTIDVRVRGDVAGENNETFFVRLRNASRARIANEEAVGIIEDDDQKSTDLAVELFFGTDWAVHDALKVTNKGSRFATDITVKLTSTPDYGRGCFDCSIGQLAGGSVQWAATPYATPGSEQVFLSAIVSARQSDPQASNNAVAWTVGAGGYMAMDAAYLNPGGTATITGISATSPPFIASSQPDVVSVSTAVTTLPTHGISFTVTGLKPGTSTITLNQNTLDVTVVQPGVTPRWPSGLKIGTGGSATRFDQPLPITITPAGRAPFTGASATGTIIVKSGSQELARRTITDTGTIQFPLYLPAVGSIPFEISYTGDEAFLPLTLRNTVFVTKGAVSLTGSLDSSSPGSWVLTVRVAGSPIAAPAGVVSVMNGTVEIGRLNLAAAGNGSSTAQMTLTGPPGFTPPTLTVNYLGDALYDPISQQIRSVNPRQRAIRH